MVGETTGKSEIPRQEAEGEEGSIEASGDALVIADAIYGGFQLLAAAVDRLTKSMEGDDPEDDRQGEFYLDGSKVR